MAEDRIGNCHRAWFDGDYDNADLEGLMEFARDLYYHVPYLYGSSIGDGAMSDGDMSDGDSEDDDVDMSEDDEDTAYLHSRSLDYVPMLVETYGNCLSLDRKEQYEWFREA